MFKKSAITSALLIIFLSMSLSAQEGRGKGRLTGVVQDEDGKPVSGVTMKLKSLQYELELSAVSDDKGKFSFYGFAGGQQPNFDLMTQRDGYIPMTLRLQLSGLTANPPQTLVLKKVEGEIIGPVDPKAVPQEQLALIKAAEEQQKAGQYALAIEKYRSFLSANPIHYRYQVNLGNCLLEFKDYEGAITAFAEALKGLKAEKGDNLKGDKFAADLYSSIGTTWTKLNNMAKAAENYKLSAQIAPPTDAALAFNLAEILMAGNDAASAIEYYSLAIKLNPKDPLYYEKIGYAHLNAGDLPKALESFTEFIKLAPEHPRAAEVKELMKALK